MPKITGELTRCQYVLKLLLGGQPVTPEEFRLDFKKRGCEHLFYKLSFYILDCKRKGAIIKSIRTRQGVVTYQLMNPNQFGSDCVLISPESNKKSKRSR